MNKTPFTILSSKIAPLRKIIFKAEERFQFYTVSFYDSSDNSLILCASSQIGCIEKCKFCATGSHKFIRNLSVEEIQNQFKQGIEVMRGDLVKSKPKLLWIILEGMGEPSYNLLNILKAFSLEYPNLKEFKEIHFRISTVGNVDLIKEYKKYIQANCKTMGNVEFEVQISLHTPFESERRDLIPGISQKYSLIKILTEFYNFSNYLNKKLRINYMLLKYPDGTNNFSEKYLKKLSQILNPKSTQIKLTKYSDTGKGFSSPDKTVFSNVQNFLISKGFEVEIRELLGQDINAACGMLHY